MGGNSPLVPVLLLKLVAVRRGRAADQGPLEGHRAQVPHCYALENVMHSGTLLKNLQSSHHIFKGLQKPKPENHSLGQVTSA